jgi:hypothetical protein
VFKSVPNTTASIGEPWCYPVLVEDPDGDAITLSLAVGPPEMALDAANTLCWTPGAAGMYYAKLVAADGAHVVSQEFFVTVVDCAGEALTITSAPVTVATEGQPYLYQVRSNHAEAIFSLAVAPSQSIRSLLA